MYPTDDNIGCYSLVRCAMVAACITLFTGSPAAAQMLKCEISEKHFCEPGKDCVSIPSSIWNKIDLSKSTYSRCDKNGCDDYQMRVSESGIYLNIVLPDRGGVIAKMTKDGPSFLEVATLGTSVYTSFGSCR